MQHTLYQNVFRNDTKQDHIAPKNRRAHLRRNLRMQTINQRVCANPHHLLTEFCHKTNSTIRVMFGDKSGYFLKIGLNPS